MRALILESGTYETFRTIASQLVAIGIETYVYCVDAAVMQDQLKREGHIAVPDSHTQTIDLVLCANFFRNPEVSKTADRIEGSFPLINITWSHPVSEIPEPWRRQGVEACNAFFKQQRIYFWIPCPFAAMEYKKLGYENGIYAPLPLLDIMLAGDYRYQWLQKDRVSYFAPSQINFSQAVVNDKQVNDYDVVYLGDLLKTPPTCSPELQQLALEVAQYCVADTSISRYQSTDLWSEIIPDGSPNSLKAFDHFHNWFFYHHARLTRGRFVKALVGQLEDRLLLYGDAWIEQGLGGNPKALVERHALYNQIPISIDFGSTSFETCFFPRTLEIIKWKGTLLSYRRPDTHMFFGQVADAPIFDHEITMAKEVTQLIENPQDRKQRRDTLHSALLKQPTSSSGLQIIIQNALGC
ncbi:hypothetical protein [Magnetococcus sp. PR-3]|uniref:hypothetical protein n=1 Tax=Magnetococcus sp. PR-3 TaxID=3120355 RepID=UPI002FCE3CF3